MLTSINSSSYSQIEVRLGVKDQYINKLQIYFYENEEEKGPFDLDYVSGIQEANKQCVYRCYLPDGAITKVRIDVLDGSTANYNDRIYIDYVKFIKRDETPTETENVITAIKVASGKNVQANYLDNADINNDENVGIEDAILGLQYIAKTRNEDTLLNGLIAFYPFNGNANDESDNGNNSIVYGATLTKDRFGSPNQAYYFDGNDDYIDIGTDSSLKPPLPVTISAWINRGSSGYGACFFMNNFSNDHYYGVWLQAPWEVYAGYGDGGITCSESRRTKIGTTVLENNKWYHLAAVIRGPNDIDLYVNGINDEGSYSGSGSAINYNDEPGNIGRRDRDTILEPDYFHGFVDEIRLYSRALSETEIELLYYKSKPIDTDKDGIIDNLDQCPDTYQGNIVDDSGCSFEQLSPVLNSPNDETADLDPSLVNFEWEPVIHPEGNTVEYCIVIKEDAEPNDITVWDGCNQGIYMSESSFQISLDYGKTYYWAVFAKDQYGNWSSSSEWRKFNTKSEISVNDGLIAYYPFEGNANDESGNGNDGIEFGEPVYENVIEGQSLTLDGIDDRVALGSFS